MRSSTLAWSAYFCRSSAIVFAAALALAGAALPRMASAQTAGQSTFDTPEAATRALTAAAKDEDRASLEKLFGADYNKLLSGDTVEDKKDMDDFAAAVQESVGLVQVDGNTYTVTVGKDAWPTPIPLAMKDGKWFFDTDAGLQQVLDRRVGENEFAAIETARAYALAQWDYYTQSDWDHDGMAEYAQRLISTPGKHDGLYWETNQDETPSPLGALVAQAQAEGYDPKPAPPGASGKGGSDAETPELPRAPYHGYYFKILTAQGAHAPGGKYSYIINGNMIAGYALVAYPSNYGNTGVMTFIINGQGRVYQKNLGDNTEKLAAAMTAYDPDPTWQRVEEEPEDKIPAPPTDEQQ
ncbi:MAG TPA: DUF2950 domain-containing protein [Candidatus Dormibacteraeota bacterium]|nr:DUF2950 domain-containing protein [Candidatus Dormibacteraeota bacterium]